MKEPEAKLHEPRNYDEHNDENRQYYDGTVLVSSVFHELKRNVDRAIPQAISGICGLYWRGKVEQSGLQQGLAIHVLGKERY